MTSDLGFLSALSNLRTAGILHLYSRKIKSTLDNDVRV